MVPPPGCRALTAPRCGAEADGRYDVATVPFGKWKGLPLAEIEAGQLRWLESALRTSIDDPSKSAYRVQT
jgi:hypothetical protein